MYVCVQINMKFYYIKSRDKKFSICTSIHVFFFFFYVTIFRKCLKKMGKSKSYLYMKKNVFMFTKNVAI